MILVALLVSFPPSHFCSTCAWLCPVSDQVVTNRRVIVSVLTHSLTHPLTDSRIWSVVPCGRSYEGAVSYISLLKSLRRWIIRLSGWSFSFFISNSLACFLLIYIYIYIYIFSWYLFPSLNWVCFSVSIIIDGIIYCQRDYYLYGSLRLRRMITCNRIMEPEKKDRKREIKI